MKMISFGEYMDCNHHYSNRFHLYHIQEIAYVLQTFNAAVMFRDALNKDPNDGPSLFERCNFYAQNPPPEDWDDVYVLESK